MRKLLLAFVAFFALTNMALAAVDLNTASKEQLEVVTGIGPVKAQAIVDYRQKNGLFRKVDDLKKVKGFGARSVAKMRSELTVGVVESHQTGTSTGKIKKTKGIY